MAELFGEGAEFLDVAVAAGKQAEVGSEDLE